MVNACLELGLLADRRVSRSTDPSHYTHGVYRYNIMCLAVKQMRAGHLHLLVSLHIKFAIRICSNNNYIRVYLVDNVWYYLHM